MCLVGVNFIRPLSGVLIRPDGSLPSPKERVPVFGGFVEFYDADGEFYVLYVERIDDGVTDYYVVKMGCRKDRKSVV